MTKKTLILLIAISFTGLATFFYWTAQLARKRSNTILANFKAIDSSLTRSNDSVKDKDVAIGAVRTDSLYVPAVDLSFKANRISVSIDSIKRDLRLLADVLVFTYENKGRVSHLKEELQEYDSLIAKYYLDGSGIRRSDLPDVADVKHGSDSIPWEVYYFEHTNARAMRKMLGSIQRRVIRVEEMALLEN